MSVIVDTSQIDSLTKAGVTKLGYDAVVSSPRRRSIALSTKSEDRELLQEGRLILSSSGRDLMRNLALCGFIVRKHCQFVSKADFKCSIPNHQEYSRLIKKFIYNWGTRTNIDVAGRNNFKQMFRLIETHRIIDGDIFVAKLGNGKLQLIEGDRVRNVINYPQYADGYEWVHGVKVGNTGRAFRYAVHKREMYGGFKFEREVSAENMLHIGYRTRADQVRGVSLLAPAINQFQDIYEGIEYALAKSKVAQLLGFVTKTEEDGRATVEEQEAAAEELKNRITEKFGAGTLHLDLRLNESAEMITDQTPSTNFQQFITNVIQIAFSSLDIPYSFYDASRQTFYGGRGELDQYIESCIDKQEELIEARNELTDWRLRLAIADGEIPPPPDEMTVDDLLWHCEWVGARMPLWRMLMDAKDAVVAMQCGLLTPQKLTGLYGMDFDENLVELQEAMKLGKLYGVPLLFANNVTTMNTGL